MTVFADSSRFIMDLGLNTGDDTAYFLAKDFEVVALEPDPTLAATARARFADAIAAKRLTVVEAAVDAVETESGAAPGLTLGDLFDRFGTPRHIKVDAGDANQVVLNHLLRQLVKPLSVAVKDAGAGLALIATLGACGYNGFQLVDLADVEAMTDPDVPDYAFTGASCGPFGEALPGPWLSQEAIEDLYAATVSTREGERRAPPSHAFCIHAVRL
ncbi:methyltransferase domain-containing protein [Xanthobacter agilis]|uniref:FkbM family methyltransferase n=1 Tax=Xanthobacter agilis TaxID=47492 RepID=A0ABU0LBE4_XANAG|nr:hypothetical protein [Xanthobacter agilis]MDQ0504455.1 hypothetical protein [Xanthobacter agilis]